MYSGQDALPLGVIGLLFALLLIAWRSRARRHANGEPEAGPPGDEAFGDSDPEEMDELDPEAAARDARTTARMHGAGIAPIRLITAPRYEAEIVLRPRAEIVERLCGLTLVAAKASRLIEGEDLTDLDAFTRQQRARHDPRRLFTSAERGFIDNPAPPHEQWPDFAWRGESALVMLWALNLIEALPPAGESAQLDRLLVSVKSCGDLPEHELRPAAELLDEEDLVFRCWTVAGMAYYRGLPVPHGLDLDVLEERRFALEWLTRDIRWRDPPHVYERDETGRLVLLRGGAVKPEWAIVPVNQPDPEEEESWSLDQRIRKRRSERLLAELDLPVYPWMPATLDESGARFWDWSIVFGRLAGTGIVAIKAADLLSGSPPAVVFNDIREKVDRFGLDRSLSPKERAFTNDPAPSSFDITQFCWRAESAWLLMWALGLVDEPLGPPYRQVDFDRFRAIYWSTIESKIVTPRSPLEILDEYDLTFRCYWPAQYFHQHGIAQPQGYDRNMLIERHHTLQWLVFGSDWDDWDGGGDADDADEERDVVRH